MVTYGGYNDVLGIYYPSYYASGVLTIPATITYKGVTYRVTSIDHDAFCDCSDLTSVNIPNSITSIGATAFSGCSNLTSVNIHSNIISIGSDAFYGTRWYNNKPDGLVYVGNVAYKYKGTMPANTSIVIKDGTVTISGHAFYWCDGLTSVSIPNSVISIGKSAFSGCSALTFVDIPNSVISIGESAFEGCI